MGRPVLVELGATALLHMPLSGTTVTVAHLHSGFYVLLKYFFSPRFIQYFIPLSVLYLLFLAPPAYFNYFMFILINTNVLSPLLHRYLFGSCSPFHLIDAWHCTVLGRTPL